MPQARWDPEQEEAEAGLELTWGLGYFPAVLRGALPGVSGAPCLSISKQGNGCRSEPPKLKGSQRCLRRCHMPSNFECDTENQEPSLTSPSPGIKLKASIAITTQASVNWLKTKVVVHEWNRYLQPGSAESQVTLGHLLGKPTLSPQHPASSGLGHILHDHQV